MVPWFPLVCRQHVSQKGSVKIMMYLARGEAVLLQMLWYMHSLFISCLLVANTLVKRAAMALCGVLSKRALFSLKTGTFFFKKGTFKQKDGIFFCKKAFFRKKRQFFFWKSFSFQKYSFSEKHNPSFRVKNSTKN